jgi:hypothetical protein
MGEGDLSRISLLVMFPFVKELIKSISAFPKYILGEHTWSTYFE